MSWARYIAFIVIAAVVVVSFLYAEKTVVNSEVEVDKLTVIPKLKVVNDQTQVEVDDVPLPVVARWQADMLSLFPDAPSYYIIAAFSDAGYASVAQVWYQQLADLGYAQHVVVCVDDGCMSQLRELGYRTILVDFPNIKTTESDSKKNFRQMMWLLRLSFIQQCLQNPLIKHLFISDVDMIWTQNIDFPALSNGFDITYGEAYHMPQDVFDRLGHVVCGCVGLYHNTLASRTFITQAVQQCEEQIQHGEHCDDQIILNEVLLYKYNISWSVPTKYGLATSINSRDSLDVQLIHRTLIQRDILSAMNCSDAWILSPKSKNDKQHKLNAMRELGRLPGPNGRANCLITPL